MITLFKLYASNLWKFIKPFITIILKQSSMILLSAAAKAVADVALNMSDLPSDQKREAAFNLIKEDIKDSGFEISASLINAVIEVAVQNQKLAK